MKLKGKAQCYALASFMEQSQTVNMRHPFHDAFGDGEYHPGCGAGHLLCMRGHRTKSPRYTGAFCMNLMHKELGLSPETCKVIYQSTWTERSAGAIAGPEVAAVLRRAAEGEEIRSVYSWA